MWKFFTALGAEKKAGGMIHSCRAKNLVGQVMADLTPGIICTFEAEDWDTDDIHSTSVNPTRFTIPAGLGGIWIFDHHIEFTNPSATHSVQSWLRKNGVGIVGGSGGNGNYGPSNHVTHGLSIKDLAAPGDYYEFLVGFNLGAARTTLAMIGSATMLSPSQQAPTSPLFPPRIAGRVNAAGAIVAGSGFTIVKGATGLYTVNFNTPMASIPAVFVQHADTTFAWIEPLVDPAPTVNGFGINMRDTGNLARDGAFNFLAMEVV